MKFNVFIRINNWKTKYTTLSKQLQNLITKIVDIREKSIPISHIYT